MKFKQLSTLKQNRQAFNLGVFSFCKGDQDDWFITKAHNGWSSDKEDAYTQFKLELIK